MSLGPVSFSGVATGFDIKSIISAILQAEHQPVDHLQAKQQGIGAKKSAFNDLSAKLTTLRTALLDLSSFTTVGSRAATSSDTSILTASAGSAADLASHEIDVQTLARASRVRSDTFANRLDPSVTDGTITIRSGARDLVTVNVSAASGNNSLSAVRDAINAANAGVSASIVNDGAGDLLVVRASNTGTANALAITDTTNLHLTAPDNVLDAAANATAYIDGVLVTSASNTLTTAIPGVTLNLLTAKPGTKVALDVTPDTDKLKDAIHTFVDSYNAVASFIGTQFSADAKTGQAGVLAGDALTRRVQETLSTAVSGGVTGIPSTDFTTLGAIGISIEGSSGLLKIDDEQLSAALTDHSDQVGRLLAATGKATDNAVSFAALTSATVPGTYAVQVTSAPERATVAGSTAIGPGGLGAAETLHITLGASSADVALTQGDTLSAIVNKLNTALSSAGVGVRASADGGKLRLSSVDYGSAVSFSVVSDTADTLDGSTTGIGTAPSSDSGVDIAGTIGGVAAAGNGTILTGDAGTSFEGLQVSVVTDAASVLAKSGNFGTVTVTRGVADTLARTLKSIVDPTGGLITSTVQGFTDESNRIRDEIAVLEDRLRDREAFLTQQFSAAEQAISALQQQQSALGKSYSLI